MPQDRNNYVFGVPGLGPVVAGGCALILLGVAVGMIWRYFDGVKFSNLVRINAERTAVEEPDEVVPVEITESVFGYRALDGVARLDEQQLERPYFAVVFDNMVDARPQHGLASASVVYAAPVEAGITRLLAIFSSGAEVEKIGPVRSARPYFVDIAGEYSAVFAHVGGSPEALDTLKRGGDFHDLNEYWNGQRFWRDKSRYAPHNVYTSSELLEEYAASREWEDSDLSSWIYKDEVKLEDRPDTVVDLVVPARSDAYTATWKFNREDDSYSRYQGDSPHVDALTGEAVRAKNVIVVFADVDVVDDVGRRRIDLESGGDVTVALDGNVYAGTWARNHGRMRFYDASGNEFKLNRGLTWVEIVPIGTEVTGW